MAVDDSKMRKQRAAFKTRLYLPGLNALFTTCLVAVLAVGLIIIAKPPDVVPAADAGPSGSQGRAPQLHTALQQRQSSNVCRRWSHQSKFEESSNVDGSLI